MRHAVFIGPDKTGSTWLQRFAEAHPQIQACQSKELFFFLRADGDRDLEWYRRRFEPAQAEHRVAFEVCHEYLFAPAAASAIAADLPGATVIAGVRHPVERAYSSYRYMVRQGRTTLGFADAVRQIDELVDHCRLAEHLEPFLDRLGAERVTLLDFDLLGTDAQAYADAASAQLGLPSWTIPDELYEKVLAAATARSARTVRALRLTASGLRRVGMYGTVEAAKRRLVESPLLFKPAPPVTAQSAAVDPDSAAYILGKLDTDIARLDGWFGTSFGARWGIGAPVGAAG